MKRAFWIPLLLLAACFPDRDTPVHEQKPGEKLLVFNEGNFQWGNATVSSYHLESHTLISTDLFSAENNRPLGDVLQSVAIDGQRLWLVVNNSGKIEIVDKDTWKSLQTIQNLGSPRYLCRINADEWLLSELYADSLSILGVADGQLRARVGLKGWTEQMAEVNGQVWISNLQSRCVYTFDPLSRTVTDSLDIGFGSFAIQKDSKGRIWVATKGSKELGIHSAVHCINPANGQFLFSFSPGPEPVMDLYVDEWDRVYYLYGDLYRIDANHPAPPQQAFFTRSGSNFYAVEARGRRVFLSDAVDFVQNGIVCILNEDGFLQDEFRAGRIPNGFLYLE